MAEVRLVLTSSSMKQRTLVGLDFFKRGLVVTWSLVSLVGIMVLFGSSLKFMRVIWIEFEVYEIRRHVFLKRPAVQVAIVIICDRVCVPCDGLGNILWLEPIVTFMEVHFKRWLEPILTWGGAAQLMRTAQQTRRYVAQLSFRSRYPNLSIIKRGEQRRIKIKLFMRPMLPPIPGMHCP